MRNRKFKAYFKPTIEDGEVIYEGGFVDVVDIDFSRKRSHYIEPYREFGGLFGSRHMATFDEAPLCEFTGLTSKDDEEIYEGHILRFKSQSWLSSLGGEEMKAFEYPILWNEEELSWGLKVSDNEWIMKLTKQTDNNQFEIVSHVFAINEKSHKN